MDKPYARSNDAERLAEFTDRLLAGKQPEDPQAGAPGAELQALQALSQSIVRNLPPCIPNLPLRNHIRARLSAEWSRSGPAQRLVRPAWRIGAALAAAVCTVAVIVAAFFTARFPAQEPGAAQAQGPALALVLGLLGVILLVALAIIVYRWLRKKH